jgi:hypothetical protein
MLALQGAQATREHLLSQTLFANSGEVCTGIQKLAQRWVLEFLTQQGSMRFLPDRGCTFLTDFYAGRLRTELDVQQTFLAADLTLRSQFALEESEDMPADERYDYATLTDTTVTATKVTLRVQITSKAGTARAVILPIDVAPYKPMT